MTDPTPPDRPDAQEVRAVLAELEWSSNEAAAVFRVAPRTMLRWVQGTSAVPPLLILALRAIAAFRRAAARPNP